MWVIRIGARVPGESGLRHLRTSNPDTVQPFESFQLQALNIQPDPVDERIKLGTTTADLSNNWVELQTVEVTRRWYSGGKCLAGKDQCLWRGERGIVRVFEKGKRDLYIFFGGVGWGSQVNRAGERPHGKHNCGYLAEELRTGGHKRTEGPDDKQKRPVNH